MLTCLMLGSAMSVMALIVPQNGLNFASKPLRKSRRVSRQGCHERIGSIERWNKAHPSCVILKILEAGRSAFRSLSEEIQNVLKISSLVRSIV
jgi:hypothetical protein